MRHCFVTILLLLFLTQAFGQKEVFFEPIDLTNRKVRSFQGIEVSVLPYKTKNVPFSIDRYSLSGYVGYYYEKAVAPTWTMRLTVGMHTVYGANYRLLPINQGQAGYYTGQWEYDTYQIYQASIEPRWNYSFKKRYTEGKANLNSSCFLSLPITYELSNTDVGSSTTLHVLPTWGFRNSISRHYFWEGAAGFGVYDFIGNNAFRYIRPKLDYSLRLGVGYAF